MEEKAKKIIEENPVALATINSKGNPHIIAVAYVKIKEDKVIITNNYMKTTIDNLKNNPNVSLAAWNKAWEGYRISGKAEYHERGKWYDFVKSMKENKNEPCKGALIISIDEINQLG